MLDWDTAVRVGVEVFERELAGCEQLSAGYDRLVEYIGSLEIDEVDVRLRLFDTVVSEAEEYVRAMIESEVERLLGCRGL